MSEEIMRLISGRTEKAMVRTLTFLMKEIKSDDRV